MKCNNCGSNLNEGASFCTNCGQKVDAQKVELVGKFCTHCGTRNDAGSKFCNVCGSSFVENKITKSSRTNLPNKNIRLMVIAGIVVIALILLFAFGLRSCGSSKLTANKSEKIVQSFFDEILDLNFEKAKEYVVDGEKGSLPLSYMDLNQIKEIYNLFGEDIITIKVDAEDKTFVINEDEASVTMEIEMKIDSKLMKEETEAIMNFKFKKIDGKWLIKDVDTIKDF